MAIHVAQSYHICRRTLKEMRSLTIVVFAGVIATMMGFSPQERPEHRAERGFTPQEDSARQAKMETENSEKLAEVRKYITGQEDKPASEVFKNLQTLKETKAGQIPGIMDFWSRSLGTTCQHCHTVDQWAKDDKPEKQIARDMAAMVGKIDTELLPNIKNLDSKNPRIGCWTCHHGSIKPQGPPWFRDFRKREG